jgi:hypothetical protein
MVAPLDAVGGSSEALEPRLLPPNALFALRTLDLNPLLALRTLKSNPLFALRTLDLNSLLALGTLKSNALLALRALHLHALLALWRLDPHRLLTSVGGWAALALGFLALVSVLGMVSPATALGLRRGGDCERRDRGDQNGSSHCSIHALLDLSSILAKTA